MTKGRLDQLVVLLAVKLVQPGILGDIHEGTLRLLPPSAAGTVGKEEVKTQIQKLLEYGLVEIYASRRYVLSSNGEAYIANSGIRAKIDARRMFLLKETRKRSLQMRSGTRDRSLQQ